MYGPKTVAREADTTIVATIRDAAEKIVEAVGEVEFACERIRDPSMTG